MTGTNSPATSGPSAMTGAVPPVCTREVAETIFGNCSWATALPPSRSAAKRAPPCMMAPGRRAPPNVGLPKSRRGALRPGPVPPSGLSGRRRARGAAGRLPGALARMGRIPHGRGHLTSAVRRGHPSARMGERTDGRAGASAPRRGVRRDERVPDLLQRLGRSVSSPWMSPAGPHTSTPEKPD